MYKAYITKLTNVRPHPNADRLLLGDCFGNTVCVSTEYTDGQVGIYFPTDGQVSVEYAEYNNLLRKKDAEGNNVGGYMDPNKRNVCAIKLRGEKSDGLFMPLESLAWAGDISTLKVGDAIDIWNGKEICKKYIPAVREGKAHGGQPNRSAKRAKRTIAPTFFEHADTEQLAYNLSAFKPGDEVEITLKMHGTSQRTGYHKVFKGWKVNRLFQRFVDKYTFNPTDNKFVEKCLKLVMKDATPIYNWDYVSGTRRVVLETYDGGFYGDNAFRKQHADVFEGKLWKGETVYYEVVGFTDTGAPIMGSCENSKVKDKEFTKQYGKTTTFSYGCVSNTDVCMDDEIFNTSNCINAPKKSDIYVYRMTMTNEDGNVIEYTPDFMRYRCEMMGVKTVPVFWKGAIPENPGSADDDTISAGEWIMNVAERFYDGPDPVGKTHIREGVVVRVLNRPTFKAYKHKNFFFKVLEGIVKDTADAPDMEEAQDINE